MASSPKKVVIIGLGGTGSWLAPAIGRALQFQAPKSSLVLIDGDSFEPKNSERQNFVSQGNKADAVRKDLRQFLSSVFIISRAAWIVSEEAAIAWQENNEDEEDDQQVAKISAYDVLDEDSYIFCMVDNHQARKLIFEAATKFDNIDIFTGGNDDRLAGNIQHYQRRNGKDVTTSPLEFHDEIANPTDKNPGEMSCQERATLEGGTQLIAANMIVAATLMAKASHIMFGTDEEKQAALEKAEIYFDLEEGLMAPYDRRPAPVMASATI